MRVDELPTGPENFPVAVLIRRKPSTSRWVDYSWQIIGVVVDNQRDKNSQEICCKQVRNSEDGDEFLWTGFNVCLYRDEAESYYFNLLAPEPSLYVITRSGEQGQPEPFIVTVSFDEANAYMESEEHAYPVAMPAELYRWVEHFTLRHYTPQQRRKRKRQNWKGDNRKGDNSEH